MSELISDMTVQQTLENAWADNTPLYNPQPTGNWPHLFNRGYVPILLHKLQKWRWHWFSYGKVTTMLLKFIWFQLIRG